MKAPMFSDDSSLALFHGTAASFEQFDHTSHNRGCTIEPNNRLGIWLTECPYEASEYAEVAGAGEDFEGVLVIEANLDPARIAVFQYNLDDFISGNFADSLEPGVISKIFRDAAAVDPDFDRQRAFRHARRKLLASGFDAIWVDTGESAMLAVLDPSRLRVAARLTCAEAKDLLTRLADHETCTADLAGAAAAPHIQHILDQRTHRRLIRP